MFSLSSSGENGNSVCISRAAGPMHVIKEAMRSAEGCLSNPVTISFAFEICNHFLRLAARFPLMSNFCGSDTLATKLEDGGILPGVLLLHLAYPFIQKLQRVETQSSLSCDFESLNSLCSAFHDTTTATF
jgi:hypothetical protein